MIQSLVYTAWQAAERKRKVRTRCIESSSAAPLLDDLMDPARREHVTASQPTLRCVQKPSSRGRR